MKIHFFTLLASLCLLSVSVFAESAGDIRRRMEQRLPALDQLKATEAIGENNRGLVEVRGSAAGAEALVAEENRDREAVYAHIAKETGTSADAVGRARAKQIATHSRGGVWVQDEMGKWAKK